MTESSLLSTSHLQLLKQLDNKFIQHVATEIDIAALAEILVCSERNVSKLMVSLEKRGVLSWSPGRGRGHRSKLMLIKNFEGALFEKLEQLTQSGKINQAFLLARQFGYVRLFQERLPLWLDVAQQTLRRQNTLMYLVPYSLPEWRPHKALSIRSILLIESVFDTLLRFDPEQNLMIPYLAHQLSYCDKQIRVRIRENVFLHNGERLTPEMVKANFDMRCETVHPYQILLRHLHSVEVEKQWVIFYLSQYDPVFLHLLADSHSAIFDHNSDTPVGTGAYQVERIEPQHWSLVRNKQYFGFGGHIERAEFWSSDMLPSSAIHVVESCCKEAEPLENKDTIEHSGCTVLQFQHHTNALSIEERSWIVYYSRLYMKNALRCEANSVMHCHQDKGFHLFNCEMKRPSRPIVVEVRECHLEEFQPLRAALEDRGIELIIQDKDELERTNAVDVFYDCYVFGDDLIYQYYEWFLCGDIFTRCLPNGAKKSLLSFIDTLMQESDSSSDFLQKLYRAEDWLIQNYYFCPLWRDHITYHRADNVYGTETSNMGVMSLVNMWLE